MGILTMWKSAALIALNTAMRLFLGELWAFLKDSVDTYERIELHSAQKRAMVREDALNHLRMAGQQISEALINLGIEAAIQAVRGKG